MSNFILKKDDKIKNVIKLYLMKRKKILLYNKFNFIN